MGGHPCFAATFGHCPYPSNVGSTLRDTDHSTRIQQIEYMAGFDALIISREGKRFIQNCLTFGFRIFKMLEQDFGVGMFQIVSGKFPLILVEHIAIQELRLAVFADAHFIRILFARFHSVSP